MKCDVLKVMNVQKGSYLPIPEMGVMDLKNDDKITVRKDVCGRLLEQYKGNVTRIKEGVEKDKLKNDWYEVERMNVKPSDKKKEFVSDKKEDKKPEEQTMEKKADNRSMGSQRGKSSVKHR
jgi:hypothetical protein